MNNTKISDYEKFWVQNLITLYLSVSLQFVKVCPKLHAISVTFYMTLSILDSTRNLK